MAAYGKGQMLGSGISPESFKQDYSGFSRAAEIQAQGLQNLGQSIGGAIQNFGEAKKEQKKVDAYNKASAKSIEAAITLGKSYGITAAEETLAPFLESYNDPNLSPIEKAALLDEGKAMIPNVFGRFDQSQALAIDKAQLLSRGTSSTSPMSNAKLVEIAVPGGTQQMFLRDGVLEPIQLNQQTGGVEFPAIGSDAIDQAINLNNIPSGAGTENLPPTGDGAPEYDPTATNILLGQGGVGFIPSKPETVETFRPFTSEEVALYGSQGQVSSTGRVYPIRPPSGTEFTTNPDGSTTYRQGAGVGNTGGLNKAPTTDLKEGEVLVADPTSPTGTKIVQVPSEAREKAKTDFSTYISQVGDSYARLNELGKAVSAGEANPLNYAFSTAVGQTMGRMFGEEGQPLRDQINTMAPNIINVIRQSTQMGSKGMDSNAEREFFIKAMGDPTLPIEANIKALDALDKAYGKGNAVEDILKNYPELAKKVNSYKLALPKASNVAPTSGSSNIYEKHGVK
jgi:hypothetical protein